MQILMDSSLNVNIMNYNLTLLKFVMLNPPFPLAAHLQFLRELHSNIGNVRFLTHLS